MVILTMTLNYAALHNGNIDATVSLANTADIRASQRAMPDTREQFDCSSTADIQQCIKYQEKPLTDLVAPMQSLIRNMLSNTSGAYKGTRAPPELELVAGRRQVTVLRPQHPRWFRFLSADCVPWVLIYRTGTVKTNDGSDGIATPFGSIGHGDWPAQARRRADLIGGGRAARIHAGTALSAGNGASSPSRLAGPPQSSLPDLAPLSAQPHDGHRRGRHLRGSAVAAEKACRGLGPCDFKPGLGPGFKPLAEPPALDISAANFSILSEYPAWSPKPKTLPRLTRFKPKWPSFCT
jgi:hypothetical protein